VPVVVTWNALAFTPVVLDRRLADGTTLLFGSAGLIYQTGIVMYDKATESFWSP